MPWTQVIATILIKIFVKSKTGIDLQMLRSQTDVIPKILIEDDEMNFDQPRDLKPNFRS